MTKLNGYRFSIETLEALLSSFKKNGKKSRSFQLSVSYLMEFSKDHFCSHLLIMQHYTFAIQTYFSMDKLNSELVVTWFEMNYVKPNTCKSYLLILGNEN